VASEVRALAGRSAEAAKEIKNLIGASVEGVDSGSRLVAEAGQTMNEIVNAVQRVADIIGEISAATGEQANGISQVNTAVNQLDQMTQQNAALVEESTAAAQSLKDQATRLTQLVGTFKLDGQPGQVSRRPRANPPPPRAGADRPKLGHQGSASAPGRPRVGLAPDVPKKAPALTNRQAPAGNDEWESF
jgi:methyl-accepting chemotaxis protein